jgi:hypothetical protein
MSRLQNYQLTELEILLRGISSPSPLWSIKETSVLEDCSRDQCPKGQVVNRRGPPSTQGQRKFDTGDNSIRATAELLNDLAQLCRISFDYPARFL